MVDSASNILPPSRFISKKNTNSHLLRKVKHSYLSYNFLYSPWNKFHGKKQNQFSLDNDYGENKKENKLNAICI